MYNALEITWHRRNIATIANFFSAQECEEAIEYSLERGYGEAPISTSKGMVMRKDIRNNERLMIDDSPMAKALWERLSPFLEPACLGEKNPFLKNWTPVGLNERLRFYKYDPEQGFNWHLDGSFQRPSGEKSLYTFLIYLNDDFEGGQTSFRPQYSDAFSVQARRGSVLLFHHPILHRGDRIVSGTKFVLRSDLMFEKQLG